MCQPQALALGLVFALVLVAAEQRFQPQSFGERLLGLLVLPVDLVTEQTIHPCAVIRAVVPGHGCKKIASLDVEKS